LDHKLPLSNENIILPDVGAMVASVQTATGRKPDFIAGKPSKLAFELISGLNSEVKPENTGNIY